MADKAKREFHIGRWKGGGAETVSGKGSTLAYTAPLRPMLEELFRKLEVKVLLDAPCGDFNWMSHVDLGGIEYIGLDIIEEVIARNIARHGCPGRTFRVSDIRSEPLPRADLMLCRDCMFHLPFADIWRVLENFVGSGTPYILMTNHALPSNRDLPKPGGYEGRNFLEAPFQLPRPAPADWLVDHPRRRGSRYLCLWSAKDIRLSIEAARHDGRLV